MVRILKIVKKDDNVELLPYFFSKQQFDNFEPVEKFTTPDENHLEISGNINMYLIKKYNIPKGAKQQKGMM